MPHRLLLADDSITIQKVIELTFADEKIDVVAVSDGEQAIARLVSERFDIVLADIGMPVKDGFEVAAFVKGHPTLGHVPVILLTGAFEPVDEARVAAVGAAAVLAKPFEPQVLVSRVRDLLRSAKPATRCGTSCATAGDGGPAVDCTAADARSRRASSSVDEYFERLDRAFANLNVPLEPRELVRSFPRPVPPPGTDSDEPESEPDVAASEAATSEAPIAEAFTTPDSSGGSDGGASVPPPQEPRTGPAICPGEDVRDAAGGRAGRVAGVRPRARRSGAMTTRSWIASCGESSSR